MKILNVLQTGSRVICNPPPTDTDRDVLIQVEEDLDDPFLINDLLDMGFTTNYTHWYAGNGDEKPFRSWRQGETNLLVTDDANYFRLFGVATVLATRLNLCKKADRIALFQAVLYGETVNE